MLPIVLRLIILYHCVGIDPAGSKLFLHSLTGERVAFEIVLAINVKSKIHEQTVVHHDNNNIFDWCNDAGRPC